MGGPQPSIITLNYFASSMNLLTMLRLFSDEGLPAARIVADGWEHYFADMATDIDPSCICNTWRGMGDELPVPTLP